MRIVMEVVLLLYCQNLSYEHVHEQMFLIRYIYFDKYSHDLYILTI